MRVVVIERDRSANGASVRNFGFVTVTGQQRGESWERARRSRETWDEIAPRAGIAIEQRGLAVVARRPEAAHVLEEFRASEMGEACELISAGAARRRFPQLVGEIEAVLWSPEDLRVESRTAIPLLAAWLHREFGVHFVYATAVHAVEPPTISTSRGRIAADLCVVCAGDDLVTLFPGTYADYGVRRCKLQMQRLVPVSRLDLPMAVMSDLSLVRYPGYTEFPQANVLLSRLQREQPAHLAAGVHLIVVQSADGSLVVGDTHVYGDTVDPLHDMALDELVLNEFEAVFPQLAYTCTERWMGTYAFLDDRLVLIDTPAERVRLVVVTSGTGASTGFAIAEEVIEELVAT